MSEVYTVPANKKFNSKREHLVVQEIFSNFVNGQKVIGLKIEAIESDPDLKILSPKDNGYRRFIKEIYFPATDSKGRINYWYETQYGC